MKNKKRWPQLNSAEAFAIISLIAALIAVILMFTSCNTEAQTPEEEKVYIEMNNGDKLELVADEYGNQYLKENAGSVYIYIPYPGETSEPDSLQFYNAKN
jgi:hypothetical protein